MTTPNHELRQSAIETLLDEIRCYLAAVDTFRREGREPRWLSEAHSRPR